MTTVQILTDEDIVTADCWARPLNLIANDDDSVSDSNCYGGGPMNNPRWILVGIFMPGFVGDRVGAINRAPDSNCVADQKFHYEFILGTPPRLHIDYRNIVRYKYLLRGKYKGLMAHHVQQQDSKYFLWYDGEVRMYGVPDWKTEADLIAQEKIYRLSHYEYMRRASELACVV